MGVWILLLSFLTAPAVVICIAAILRSRRGGTLLVLACVAAAVIPPLLAAIFYEPSPDAHEPWPREGVIAAAGTLGLLFADLAAFVGVGFVFFPTRSRPD